MPDLMILKKNGLARVDYNPDLKSNVEVLVDNPMVYLRFDCKIEPDVTVGDICDFVRRHQGLKDFISCYSHCKDIDAFHEELVDEKPCDYLDVIEFYWSGSVNEDEVEYAARMHGLNGSSDVYGLDFCTLGSIKHLPVRLNSEFKLYDTGSHDETRFSGKKEFSLLQILDSLYWEISYYGSPQERDKLVEEMEKFKDELFDDGPFYDEPYQSF